MSKLELFLLGTPRVYRDGQEIRAFNTRKDLALLAYLAVTGTAHSREALAGLLWSDLPDDKARRNLRNSLSNLRKAIGLAWIYSDGTIGLTDSALWTVDSHRLAAAVNAPFYSTGQGVDPLHLPQLQALEEALALYQGDFLEGFRLLNAALFEEWMIPRREEYRLMALRGLEALTTRSLEAGHFSIGLASSRRLLSLEPWSEIGHRLQMELLARNGQRGAALAQYESCRAILADELGVVPMAETIALYEQIRAGDIKQNPVRATGLGLPAGPVSLISKSEADQTSVPIPHNLPAALVPLIGYASEMAYLQAQTQRAEWRLLTIVGMGGAGKTHLAQESGRRIVAGPAAARFPDGVFFVALDTIPKTEEATAAENQIAVAIAKCIGSALGGNESPQAQIQKYLSDKRMLLILDNMEHLIAGCRLVSQLLQRASGVCILATSRTDLDVQGEYVLELRGLNSPRGASGPTGNQRRINDAMALFVYRAQMVDRHFQVTPDNIEEIAHICQLVDGLPLGIEIAARWVGQLDLKTLGREIATSSDFLRSHRRDIAPRHQSLRAVFNHSWALLPPEHQNVLASLGVFRPSFPAEAGAAIANATAEDLWSLVNRSLLTRRADGTFGIHPAIHQFAGEKLAEDPDRYQFLTQRYIAYYLDLLTKNAPLLFTGAWAEIRTQLFADVENLKAAFWQAIQTDLWAGISGALDTVRYIYDQLGWYWEGAELCCVAAGRLADREEAKYSVIPPHG